MDVVCPLVGAPHAGRVLETHSPNRLQVVREPLDGAHLERESEVLGQPIARNVQVTLRGALDPGLVLEVDLVALEEDCLVGLIGVQRRALSIGP